MTLKQFLNDYHNIIQSNGYIPRIVCGSIRINIQIDDHIKQCCPITLVCYHITSTFFSLDSVHRAGTLLRLNMFDRAKILNAADTRKPSELRNELLMIGEVNESV